MRRVIFVIQLVLLLSYMPLYASNDPASPPLKPTSTTSELLLFYDWDELLVEAPSRRVVPIKQVAENIAIVTAEQIRMMNARSINEILRYVNGVYVSDNNYYSGSGTMHIHTSDYENNQILLDGVRINDADQGFTYTPGVPVQIIDRIEVVKGPASSAWGSALGGVVNIITKDAGMSRTPHVHTSAGFSEGNGQDYRADIAGKVGRFGYYFYAGHQELDGLKGGSENGDRFYDNQSLYGKLSLNPAKDVSFIVSGAYWEPRSLLFDRTHVNDRVIFGADNSYLSGKLEVGLTTGMKLKLNLYCFENIFNDERLVLESDAIGDPGDMIFTFVYDNKAYGGDASITWDTGRHAMLLGTEYYTADNDKSVVLGQFYQVQTGNASEVLGNDDIYNFGIFVNDTIQWDNFTLTPGLRYDHLEFGETFSEDHLNPSIGATYALTERTLLRATVARAFARPGISTQIGWDGTFGFNGSPNVESQTSWSYQGGIESGAIEKLHLKADLFYHNVENDWYWNSLGQLVNGGITVMKGFECEATINPIEKVTANLGYNFVRKNKFEDETDNFQILNTTLRYKDKKLGELVLFGKYKWYGILEANTAWSPKYDDMVIDFHYNKDLYARDNVNANVFLSGRNLFNGSSYSLNAFKTPERWFEAGLRVHF